MTIQRKVSVFGFVALSFLSLYFLGTSSIFTLESSRLSPLITIDVLLTIPFIYFLLIRRTNISKITIIPVTIAGVILASYIIPIEHQGVLDLFRTWILPLVEILLVIYVVLKVRTTIKRFKKNQNVNSEIDFYTALKQSSSTILPKILVTPFATEIAVIYYGFINWKKRKLNTNEFTYHKNSGSISLFSALILILAAESVGVHYMLRQSENQVGVWILTLLSLYTVLQVLGFAKSILKRPIKVTNKKLLLRYGIMKEAEIDLLNILAVEITTRDIDKDKRIKRFSLLGGLESHNFILHLNSEIKISGLYGIKSKTKSIALSIDKPEEFKMALKEAKRLLRESK